jgi:hypothetical protein
VHHDDAAFLSVIGDDDFEAGESEERFADVGADHSTTP